MGRCAVLQKEARTVRAGNERRGTMEPSSIKKYAAETLGTFVLTLFGCGSAAIGGAALGPVGIALAFGLSIVAMAFVIGNVSGCHINPAVSLGLFLDRRLSGKDLIGYWVAQFVGGIVAAAVLALIISLCDLGGVAATGLGCNGYDLSLIHICRTGAATGAPCRGTGCP